MYQSIFILVILTGLGLSSCDRHIPFEKNKWEKHVDGFYPYRNDMIEDLLQTKSLKESVSVRSLPFLEIMTTGATTTCMN